jgi:hypothetical protein
MSRYDTVEIKQTEKFITISSEEDIGGRASSPSRSQKGVEQDVKAMHTSCKKSSLFTGCRISYEAIDWYDSCDSFLVPGARMGKSDRKPQDESDYSNDTPKAWNEHKSIQFNATVRNASPIELGLRALGVRADVKAVQKMLKKNNGYAYINDNGEVVDNDDRYY